MSRKRAEMKEMELKSFQGSSLAERMANCKATNISFSLFIREWKTEVKLLSITLPTLTRQDSSTEFVIPFRNYTMRKTGTQGSFLNEQLAF